MTILGIDPGYAIVGYGLISYDRGEPRALQYGVIRTSAKLPMQERLVEIYRDITALIRSFSPDAAAIERLYFNTNETTAINVAQARGVIVLACAEAEIPIAEYTPLQVKSAVVGYGNAEKKQVMELTRMQLRLEKTPRPDDAADALAIAICHAHSSESAMR